MLVIHHASIWKVLKQIRKDQRDNENLMAQSMAGIHSIKKTYQLNQQEIGAMIEIYLSALSYRLKL